MDELTELVIAYLEVDAARVLMTAAAERADAALLAAHQAGHTPAQMAKAIGKDRTTVQHRLKRART